MDLKQGHILFNEKVSKDFQEPYPIFTLGTIGQFSSVQSLSPVQFFATP